MKLRKPIIIGLTGGIGSGKSTVLKELAELGATVVESDKITHGIYLKGKPVYKKVIKEFGNDILQMDKQIDRKKLSDIIFSNPAKRKKLEKITHPEIIKEIKSQIKRLSKNNKVIVVDAPLLFEAKIESIFSKIIVAWVPKELQVSRLVERDKITEQEAQKRISAQIPIDKKKKMGDYVIDNSGSIESTIEETRILWINIFIKHLLTR